VYPVDTMLNIWAFWASEMLFGPRANSYTCQFFFLQVFIKFEHPARFAFPSLSFFCVCSAPWRCPGHGVLL
jgi:hypothetical protein